MDRLPDTDACRTAVPHPSRQPDAAGWLHLAATPVFVLVAAWIMVSGTSMTAASAMAHDAGPFGTMTAMYLLMALFHAGPWLAWVGRKLGRRRNLPGGGKAATATIDAL